MLKKIISGALVLATLVCMAPAVIAEDEAAALTLTDSSHLTLDRDSGYIDGIDGTPTVAELAADFVGSVTVSGADGNAKDADDAVATDDVVSCGDDSLKALIYGDVNGDGKINMTDALAILKYAAKWGNELSELAADVDKDGKTTISDAVKLLKAIAGWDGISLGNVRMIAESKKLTAPAEDSSIDLFFTSMMDKVGRTQTESTGNYTYKMSAARNEYESCQVILVSDKDVEGLTAEITDFEYEYGGATLEASLNWEFYLEMTVFDSFAAQDISICHGDYYPEALPKMAETFELAAGAGQGIAITAKVGKDAPAGMYRATFSVKNADGEVIKTAYVYTYVWDFTLPDAPYSASLFGISFGMIYEYAKDYAGETGIGYDFYEFMLEHNLSTYVLPTDINSDDADKYMSDPRVTSFVIAGMDNKYGSMMARNDDELIAAYNKVMSNPEWAKKGLFYLEDEPWGDSFENVKKYYDRFTRLTGDSDIRTIVPFGYSYYGSRADNIDSIEYLKDYVNVWCPLSIAYANFEEGYTLTRKGIVPAGGSYSYGDMYNFRTFGESRARLEAMRDRGDELWWYICIYPSYPYTNIFKMYQGVIIRDLMWQQYYYDIDGLLYYATQETWGKISLRNFDIGNGDGVLLYIGSMFGQDNYPVASWRLVQLRDAFDDFDYLRMAEELCGRDAVLAVSENVTTGLQKFTEDERVLEACREELAEMIVAAQAKEK